MNLVRQGALLGLLLMVPVTCSAFGGKVSYPNGSPAVGAQVNLIIDDTSKPASLLNGGPLVPPQVNTLPGGMSGNVSLPNRSPMAPPQGKPAPSPKIRATVNCDATGRFSFPNQSPTNAMIQIKAADGNDFATVTLPATFFAKGDVAIVLQPKSSSH
jgi:hypothetical protein